MDFPLKGCRISACKSAPERIPRSFILITTPDVLFKWENVFLSVFNIAAMETPQWDILSARCSSTTFHNRNITSSNGQLAQKWKLYYRQVFVSVASVFPLRLKEHLLENLQTSLMLSLRSPDGCPSHVCLSAGCRPQQADRQENLQRDSAHMPRLQPVLGHSGERRSHCGLLCRTGPVSRPHQKGNQ